MQWKIEEILLLTWETHQRTASLAENLGVDYHCYDKGSKTSLKRYLHCIKNTIVAVENKKPRAIIAQCPSFILILLLMILKPFYGFKLVIDIHNIVLEYLYSISFIQRIISKFILSGCDLIIVTNYSVLNLLKNISVQKVVLPDPLPKLLPSNSNYTSRSQKPIFTLVASFHEDEPIEIFLRAINKSQFRGTLYVTGSKSKARHMLQYESAKIIFTDYLPIEIYHELIVSSDLVIDLTTRENCIVCGAYESLAGGTMALLSNDKETKSLFGNQFIYSDCSEESYINAITQFLNNYDEVKPDLSKSISAFMERWEVDYKNFIKVLQSVVCIN